MLREWIVRAWGTIRGTRSDRDLEEELRLHVDLATEESQRRDGSARAATLRVGGVTQSMDRLRDQRGLPWLDDLMRDLRFGCRMLATNPGFAIVAVASLAIGTGANCAVFTFADTLLLRPLTVARPGEMVRVGFRDSFRDALSASYREYIDIRDRAKSFSGLVAFTDTTASFAAEPGAIPKLSIGMLVTGNFFDVMDRKPELGRDFRPEENEVTGRDAVVILGHDYWTQQFGADQSILGRTVRMNGIDFTVIGVAPEEFTGFDQYVHYQFYTPLMMWPRLTSDSSAGRFEARDDRRLIVAGRLASGVSISHARAELSIIAADLERAYPETNRDRLLVARTELQDRIAQAPPIARLMAMLTFLAWAVLLVACANVAGLLASRAPMRSREIALRVAIGAGRRRVIRQLLTESVLIAVLGGAFGLLVGYAAVRLFNRVQIPTDLPIAASFELNQRALLFNFLVALLSAMLFGVLPAIRSTRADLTAVMKVTGPPGSLRRRRWGRALLVGGQVAVSVILLVVATFIYRGFQQQLTTGPGFRTDHLLIMTMAPRQLGYTDAQAQQFFELLAERARGVPGVKSAALTRYMPMDGVGPPVTILPEGFTSPEGEQSVSHQSSVVDEHYFDTLGVPILKGRAFRATDSADAPKVAIVNQVVAERYWPGKDPVGRRFRLDHDTGPWVEIVGVSKTTKYGFIIERPTEFLYLPYRQRASDSLWLLIESVGHPTSVVAPLREVVRSLDPNLPISNVRTMDDLYRMRSVDIVNVIISLIASMGIMGLGLAVVGLYGLVAYAASRRTREIGIRMAIGAGGSNVVRMVLAQGMTPALAGLAAGLLASVGVSRSLSAIFTGGPGGDGRTDVVALPLVAFVVLGTTFLAAYIPAYRASRINPTEALRCD